MKLYNRLQFNWTVFKDALKFGWPLALSSVLWYFLSGVDSAMLEKLNDSYTFGFYAVGIQISGFLAVFYTAIAQTFEPDIYKAISENNRNKTLKIIGGIISLNAIPNILFVLFAPFIVKLLTYDRYTDASTFARILALKNISTTFYYSAITVIVGYSYTKSELVIRSIGALLCILMFKYLISKFGFYGAAWGQVLSFVIMTIIAGLFILYKIKNSKKNNRIN
jgi:O-antigen/teichoic acid export membrane protein